MTPRHHRTSPARSILVIGAGSVGRRHATNLASLGFRISAVDPRPDRLQELKAALPDECLGAFVGDLQAGLALSGVDAVVIATPTGLHVEHGVAALALSVPILMEKPISTDLETAERFAERANAAGVPVLLGYTWRWWPAVERIRELIADGAVGTLRRAQMSMSAHLADWHPWEPYQEFFMASTELGGGALLDESHWVDLALALFGEPAQVSADIGRLSDLQIDTDDNVELLMTHLTGVRSSIHLDIHGRPHERTVRISGSEGTIEWSSDPEAVRIGVGSGRGEWTEEIFSADRNVMFMRLAQEFDEIIRGSRAPSCSLNEGLAVMRVVEAARVSSHFGRRVTPDPATGAQR